MHEWKEEIAMADTMAMKLAKLCRCMDVKLIIIWYNVYAVQKRIVIYLTRNMDDELPSLASQKKIH